jgi:hypothetical protein
MNQEKFQFLVMGSTIKKLPHIYEQSHCILSIFSELFSFIFTKEPWNNFECKCNKKIFIQLYFLKMYLFVVKQTVFQCKKIIIILMQFDCTSKEYAWKFPFICLQHFCGISGETCIENSIFFNHLWKFSNITAAPWMSIQWSSQFHINLNKKSLAYRQI